MIFSSSVFLFLFLPMLLLAYYSVGRKHRHMRNAVLLLASLFFYAWGEPVYVFLMLMSILLNYAAGLFLARPSKHAKAILTLSVVYNIGILFVFKYLGFACEVLQSFTGRAVRIRQIVLPIGISFFTFQIMSYVIDVYRGRANAQKSLPDLALYISLFPQLIAGPIVRYVDVAEQIGEREESWDRFACGALRFMCGFSKKVLIADQLSPLVDTVFSGAWPSMISHWIGALAYSLQIYFDFSGYSDMAIGLGKLFGFDFLENFNYPYISRSVKEFWRRWHISLSSWFRDYVYIPLGGNRKGTARTYFNLLVVFFLTGLWHGASYNFIVWGMYYAVFLILERVGLDRVLDRLPSPLQRLYTLFVVMIGWVFFRADTMSDAIVYIRGMFVPYGRDLVCFRYIMDAQYWTFLAFGVYFSTFHAGIGRFLSASPKTRAVSDWCTVCIFILAVCYLVGSGYSPFLYFRF